MNSNANKNILVLSLNRFLHEPKDRVWSWGPVSTHQYLSRDVCYVSFQEWNFEKYDEKYKLWPARKYVGDSIQYFINEFHIDGE